MEKDKAIRSQIHKIVSKEIDIEELKTEKRLSSTGLSMQEENIIKDVLD